MSTDKQSKGNSAFKEFMKNSPLVGIYLAEVISTKDLGRTGMIKVEIPSIGKDTEYTAQQFDCMWTSPFAGTTNVDNTSDNPIEGYETTQKSYGMWMVPPDIGNLLLVAFADNNTKYPYVISCLYSDKRQHMVPGLPVGKNFSDPKLLMPVAEKNKYDSRETHNDAVRALSVDLAEGVVKQGLINDPLRGAGTSGARRESPSQVFGFLTPGPVDPNNERNRLGGHQFVMDDKLENRLIRLRTAGGAQILMDDTTGVTYVINKKGTAWVELGTDGAVNIYSESSINMRSKGNFNIRADKNVNIEAGQDVNIKAAGDNTGTSYEGIGGPNDFNGPKGTGGNIRMESVADTTILARLNAKITAGGGEIETDSAGATRMKSGTTGSLGFMIKTKGNLSTDANKDVNHTAGGKLNLLAGGDTQVSGAKLHLNSSAASGIKSGNKSAVDGEAAGMVPAPYIGTIGLPDAPEKAPEFNRKNAISGQASAAPTAGKRTGNAPTIDTIVSVMTTAEPFGGHYQYDPLSAPDTPIAANPDVLDALPSGSNNLSGKPNDVNTPAGFKKGAGYTDAASGNPVTDMASAASGAASSIADAVPQYEGVTGVTNNFKSATQHKLTEINNLSSAVTSMKAAIPSVRVPTITAKGSTIIGLGKKLTELESQLSQFAVNANGLSMDLNSASVQNMKSNISDAKSKIAAGSDIGSLTGELNAAGISVIQDGPSIIFEDKSGNRIVDVSNGIGPVGETLGAVSELSTSYENVKGSITAPLSENQALAVGSFARSVGEETFRNSNVLTAINAEDYAQVPRLMQQYSYTPLGDDPSSLFGDNTAQGMRDYEGSLFQSPDSVALDIDLAKIQPGEITYSQMSSLLDQERNKYTDNLQNGTSI